MPMTSDAIIDELGLARHPEGGWYREIYRSALSVEGPKGTRTALTAIYHLLQKGEVSRWHVVDADEIWNFYDGAPLELLVYDPAAHHLERTVLAPLSGGCVPVQIVPAGVWQAARSLGDYTLTGCSVGPGFEFTDFHFVAALPDHAGHFAQTLDHLRDLL